MDNTHLILAFMLGALAGVVSYWYLHRDLMRKVRREVNRILEEKKTLEAKLKALTEPQATNKDSQAR